MKYQKDKSNWQNSSSVPDPHSVKGARNQSTLTDQKRFPWTTLIIVLLVILIVGTIFLLIRV